jgi:uncharacterized integral membrane protein
MQAKMIGLVVLLLVLLIFALQNTQPVAVKFLFWETTVSAVLTILVSFILGALTGVLLFFMRPRRSRKL